MTVHRAVFVLSVLAIICGPLGPAVLSAEQAQKQEGKEQTQPAGKEAPASLTGCVDEQEGNYVLLSDRTMNPVASLQADGFPREAFAKHVGHKVTVRGTSSSQGAMPVFKVRTIETVSDTCTPQG
jgi:hypothetical protein